MIPDRGFGSGLFSCKNLAIFSKKFAKSVDNIRLKWYNNSVDRARAQDEQRGGQNHEGYRKDDRQAAGDGHCESVEEERFNRLYIDLEQANKLYYDNDDLSGQFAMNRRDRQNGKLWIDLDTNEISAMWLSSGDEVIEQIVELVNYYIGIDVATETAESTEPANFAESTETAEELAKFSDQEIYDLCKEAGISLWKDGHLAIRHEVSAATVAKIKRHKEEIVDALSGYCFSCDVHVGFGLHNWAIYRISSIADVSYPPVTIFEGTASEVDAWAKDHQDDPFFTDRYTSKYVFRHKGK